jgi:hypothetical protein
MTAQRSRCLASTTILSAAFVLSANLFAPRAAHAQDDKVARAAILAREAEDLQQKGNIPEACNKLEESQVLDPRGGTLLDLALCRDKEGRIGTAYNLFVEAEKIAIEEKRNDRVTTAKVKKNELFLKLPRVTVVVPADVVVEGMEVRLGHANDPRSLKLIPQSEWGKAVAADPGELKLMVSAPKKATWESVFKIAKAERKSLTVPALVEGSGPAPLPEIVFAEFVQALLFALYDAEAEIENDNTPADLSGTEAPRTTDPGATTPTGEQPAGPPPAPGAAAAPPIPLLRFPGQL